MSKLNFIATTTFGLEATVKREVIKLGYENIKVLDGRIDFQGDETTIVSSNIWLRSADRVWLNIGEFEAFTFDELFEKTKALPWTDFITEDGKFTVIGKSIKSQLFSISDCQAIVKKAVVEKLKLKYNKDWFDETGAEYRIQVGILKDHVTLMIDTTGPGLHKRGYRDTATAAPLKETLAAALIDLSYWRKNRVLIDPVCGSGTIPIEAALIAKNIAPGISRKFVSENWPQISPKIWKEARAEAYEKIDVHFRPEIFGSDIDPKAIEIAKHNAKLAGVDDCIKFEVKDLNEIILPCDYGVVICNPPYGERIGTTKEVERLYKNMGNVFDMDPTWSVYVITSYEDFEKLYGRRADAKRKLFNGMIKTDYFQFQGTRPPKDVQFNK